MNLYEILLPVEDNSGFDLREPHRRFAVFLLETAGGYTVDTERTGAWRDPKGNVILDRVRPYRVAGPNSLQWRMIVERAFELFPDQEAIFHAKIGEATIEDRPAAPLVLSVNDLAAIDLAAEKGREGHYYD